MNNLAIPSSSNIKFAPLPPKPNKVIDPNSIAMREALATELRDGSAGIQNIESPWQGLAQLAGAAMGGYAEKKVAEDKAQNNQFLAEALGGAMQGNLPADKLNQIIALNPEMGMQLMEKQQAEAKAAEAKAQEDAQRQQVSAALRAMGATQEADAFDAKIITAEKAYEVLIDSQGEYRPLTADEAAKYGLPSGDGYQVDRKGNIDAIGGGNTTIQMPAGETSYDRTLGELNAKKFDGYQTAAETGVRSLTTLQAMETAMADPGFYSGAFGDPVAMLKKVGANLGIDPAGISSIETFNSLSKQSALNVMGGSLGSGFSNADRDFVMDQVANIDNTEDGNRSIIALQRKLAERQIQIGQLAQQYAEDHSGRLDYRFTQALAQWAEQNPVFPEQAAGGGDTSLPDPFSIRGGM